MTFTASHRIAAPRQTVWQWHTRPGAATRLSPPAAPMTVVQQADNLATGTTVFSLPAGLKWTARHDLSRYQAGYSFADICTNAPLRTLANWRHVHLFADAPEDPQQTIITDIVDSRIPNTFLEPLFAYRQQQLIGDLRFATTLAEQGFDYAHLEPTAELTIALTGASGTIGRALRAQLQTLGFKVIPLVRSRSRGEGRVWNPQAPAADLLAGVDIVIHLAGEPIFGRFNESHKEAIYSSRVTPTARLAELAARTPSVQALITASAIGFYGNDRGDEVLEESSGPGDGFLAEVVQDWEAATAPATAAGVRTVHLRTGAVLSGRGGLLPLLKTLFSTGLGGPFGDGQIWFSWISADDLGDLYIRAALDSSWSGPINAVAPNPVLNKELASAIGSNLHRPALIPIPSLGPTLLLGKEGAQELALANQRVVPAALSRLDRPHHFRYPTIDGALAHELGVEKLQEPAR